MNFGGECVVYFQRRCRLKFVHPYGPMLTKTNKKIRNKSKMPTFEKQKKNVLEMEWNGIFPPKLASTCLTGSEKTDFTDDDGRLRDDSSSAVQ